MPRDEIFASFYCGDGDRLRSVDFGRGKLRLSGPAGGVPLSSLGLLSESIAPHRVAMPSAEAMQLAERLVARGFTPTEWAALGPFAEFAERAWNREETHG